MEEELEMFDQPPSFSDLMQRLKGKFGVDITLQGRFDVGTSRSRYVMMPLLDSSHWTCYTCVLQGCNSKMAEVVVERLIDDDEAYFEDHGGDEAGVGVDVDATHADMNVDG
jgi:hypothetical protein